MLSYRGRVTQGRGSALVLVALGAAGQLGCGNVGEDRVEPELGVVRGGSAIESVSAAGRVELAESTTATQLVEALQARFAPQEDDSAHRIDPSMAPPDGWRPRLLPAVASDAVMKDGARLLPRFAKSVPAAVRMSFPERADAPFQLIEPRTGVAVTASLRGARSVLAENAKGYLVYREALPNGGDLIHAPLPTGTEDWMTIPSSSMTSVSYQVDLASSVAGLRLYANTLEILDAGGMPRLRVSPPYLVDSKFAVHSANLALSGCAFDASPAPPWSHPVTPAGARSCTVTVSWNPSGIAYPAVLDPAWTGTANLAAPGRYGHAAARLNDGTVLVAGGFAGVGAGLTAIASAERFTLDGAGVGVWAAAASLTGGPRGGALGVARLNRFFVISGTADFCAPLNTAEYFSTATNTWTATTMPAANPPRGHRYGTATLLPDARILVAGGVTPIPPTACGGTAQTPQVWVDIYDINADAWTQGADLPAPRAQHTATELPNATVVLIGGQSAPNTMNPSGFLATTAIFTRATNLWTAGPSLTRGRRWHGAVSLNDSTIDLLVFGGRNDEMATEPAATYGTTERWTGGASWAAAAPMLNPRQWNTGAETGRLSDGSAVAALGNALATPLADAEIFNPTSGMWTSSGALAGGSRSGNFTVTALGGIGQLLVAGGAQLNGASSAAVDLYATLPTPVDGGTDAADARPDAAPDAITGTGGLGDAMPDTGAGGGPGDGGRGDADAAAPDSAGTGGAGGAGGTGGSAGTGGTTGGSSDAAVDARGTGGTGGGASGTGGRADSGSDSGVVAAAAEDDGGCGCRLASQSQAPRSVAAFGILAMLGLVRRRRSQANRSRA